MKPARAVYFAIILLLGGTFLWFGYSTPPYHTDVLYITLLLAVLTIGAVGSSLLRPWWINGLFLGASWPVFYLLLALKHGFLLSGFLSHSKYAVVIFAITSGVGGSIRAVSISLQRRNRRSHRAAV